MEIEKICTRCRRTYFATVSGQTMCLDCIMIEEPHAGPGTNADAGGFSNWFIYHWRRIRKAADIARKERDSNHATD